MSKFLNFQNEEECTCGFCEIIDEYVDNIIDVESIEELRTVIAELVDEVRAKVSEESLKDGFDVGYKVGYKSSLEADIEVKQSLLKDIENDLKNDVCCCCDECDCED